MTARALGGRAHNVDTNLAEPPAGFLTSGESGAWVESRPPWSLLTGVGRALGAPAAALDAHRYRKRRISMTRAESCVSLLLAGPDR
jgi:hypothetical protein